MDSDEDLFCETFYAWWSEMTSPQRMTWEIAGKLFVDCQYELTKQVADRIPTAVFNKFMRIALKVMVFGLSWSDAKQRSMDELQEEYKIPKH